MIVSHGGQARMIGFTQSLKRDEDGAVLIEYTVLIAILLAAVTATMGAVGGGLGTQWTSMSTAFGALSGTRLAYARRGRASLGVFY
jgi:pilus assembly protein Flp/PilA